MAIVAAIDSSERAPAVIEQAHDLCQAYDVALHIVHAADPTGDFRRDLGDVSAESLNTGASTEQTLDRVRAKATEVAAKAASDVDNLDEYEAVGLVGDPPTVIKEYAAEHDAEYIVVSGRQRHPLGQALFGSVTQSLLLNADRPVVAVPHS